MKTPFFRFLFLSVLVLIAGDSFAQSCPEMAGTLEEGILCKRDQCADLSVPNDKGYSKDAVYAAYCWDNPDWGAIRSDDLLTAVIDKMGRTRYATPIVFLSPCDCLDKLAKDFSDCKVEVCKPSKSKSLPPAPSLQPVAEPEPAVTPPTEAAGATEPAPTKDGGGCSLLQRP